MGLAAAAGIGAVATVGGAVLSNRASRHAAGQAADTSREATEAANQLTRETYGQNAARLDPIYQSGRRATGALEGLLGIGDPTAPTGYGAAALPGAAGGGVGGGGASFNTLTPEQDWANRAVAAMMPRITNKDRRKKLESITDPIARFNQAVAYSPPTSDQYPLLQQFMSSNPRPAPGPAPAAATPALNQPDAGTPGTPAGTTPAASALIDPMTGQPMESSGNPAFDTFRQSTDYQWRYNQGQKALEMSRLPGGGYDSGYTRKALTNYGGHEAAQEIAPYMDRLTQIMTSGNQAAGALAGVATNATNSVNANNMGNATNAANLALANGTNQGAMYGSIAGAIGQAATTAFGGQNSGMYGSSPPVYYTGSDRSYTRGA